MLELAILATVVAVIAVALGMPPVAAGLAAFSLLLLAYRSVRLGLERLGKKGNPHDTTRPLEK